MKELRLMNETDNQKVINALAAIGFLIGGCVLLAAASLADMMEHAAGIDTDITLSSFSLIVSLMFISIGVSGLFKLTKKPKA